MTPRRPRDIGTAAETALVRWLRVNGWPHAERRALRGCEDAGDVTGTPGVCWEVKAGEAAHKASDAQVQAWLEETAREAVNAGSAQHVLVLRRKGKASPGDWWAVTRWGPRKAPYVQRVRLEEWAIFLRHAGYGDPL